MFPGGRLYHVQYIAVSGRRKREEGAYNYMAHLHQYRCKIINFDQRIPLALSIVIQPIRCDNKGSGNKVEILHVSYIVLWYTHKIYRSAYCTAIGIAHGKLTDIEYRRRLTTQDPFFCLCSVITWCVERHRPPRVERKYNGHSWTPWSSNYHPTSVCKVNVTLLS